MPVPGSMLPFTTTTLHSRSDQHTPGIVVTVSTDPSRLYSKPNVLRASTAGAATVNWLEASLTSLDSAGKVPILPMWARKVQWLIQLAT